MTRRINENSGQAAVNAAGSFAPCDVSGDADAALSSAVAHPAPTEARTEQPRFVIKSAGGLVTIHSPSPSKPYFRLVYRDLLGRRRMPSGGADLASAIRKAEGVERRLLAAAGPAAEATTVNDLFDAYIDPLRPRIEATGHGKNKPWGPGYLKNQRNRLKRHVVPTLGQVALHDLTDDHLQAVLDEPSTESEASELHLSIKRLVRYGVLANFFGPKQLSPNDLIVRPRPNPRPARRDPAYRDVEEDLELVFVRHIEASEVPSDRQVQDLARAEVHYPHWEGMVNTLAYVGLRISECLALTAYDLRLTSQAGGWGLLVRRQLFESETGGHSFIRPKNGRMRSASVCEETPLGFPLLAWLQERSEKAIEEKLAGTNPDAILFPAPRGDGYWWLNNLRKRVFKVAAKNAGWPHTSFKMDQSWIEGGKKVTRRTPTVQWTLTIHSLRHRFATTGREVWKWNEAELCLNGGWASEEFVMRRYYGRTRETYETSHMKQRRAMRPSGSTPDEFTTNGLGKSYIELTAAQELTRRGDDTPRPAFVEAPPTPRDGAGKAALDHGRKRRGVQKLALATAARGRQRARASLYDSRVTTAPGGAE